MSTGRLYGAPRIVERRYRALVVVLLVVGLGVGIGYSGLIRPTPSAAGEIVLPSTTASGADATSVDTRTQASIVTSTVVLAPAAKSVSPPISIDHLERLISGKAVSNNILRIEARGPNAGRAVQLVAAVTRQYQGYVKAHPTVVNGTPVVIQSPAAQPPLSRVGLIIKYGLLGLAAGLVVGILVGWKKRRDWRDVQLIQ